MNYSVHKMKAVFDSRYNFKPNYPVNIIESESAKYFII